MTRNSSQQVKKGEKLFLRGNHATSVSDGLSGRIVAVSGSDPGSTFRYPGSIEVRLFDIRCTTSRKMAELTAAELFFTFHKILNWRHHCPVRKHSATFLRI